MDVEEDDSAVPCCEVCKEVIDPPEDEPPCVADPTCKAPGRLPCRRSGCSQSLCEFHVIDLGMGEKCCEYEHEEWQQLSIHTINSEGEFEPERRR